MQESRQEKPGPEYGDLLMTVTQFCKRYPHLYPKEHNLRWILKDRASNGLMDYGGVVEVCLSGGKPTLLIHIPSWFDWVRAGGAAAPKASTND